MVYHPLSRLVPLFIQQRYDTNPAVRSTSSQKIYLLCLSGVEGLLSGAQKPLNDHVTNLQLYKVVANNVEQGIDNLRTLLQSRETPESRQQLAEVGVPFEDYLPQQKKSTAIDAEKVDWKMLDNLGLSRDRLEQNGEL